MEAIPYPPPLVSTLRPPNPSHLAALLRAHPDQTLPLHARALKLGLHRDLYLANNLLHSYFRRAMPGAARRAFEGMVQRDEVSWRTVLNGLLRVGMVDEAREVFDGMPEIDEVSWNVMIAAYVRMGRYKDALKVYEDLRKEGMEIGKFVATSVLAACTGIGALESGQRIHRHIIERGIELDVKLGSALIDMYCKCGCMEIAYEIFDRLKVKGLSSWNCMIGGFAVHGMAKEAIWLFEEMLRIKVRPDGITLLNLLTACAHGGLVKEGKYYFEYIVRNFEIEPKVEHYGCLVDLLGRVGMVWEAKKVIDEMPMEPDSSVLGALLGACKIYKEIELGEQIAKLVIELEPFNSGRYVLLANLYASVGRWEDVAKVRKLMDDKGVKKEPGCSVIEMRGTVSEFRAGGISHPRSADIYAKMHEVLERIRREGYIPQIEQVFHDIVEEEKETPLFYHSEKLAIAYGLLNTTIGQTIRISKNLRVCGDCHEVCKYVSLIYEREIIVRDRNRFHHFKNGSCSCEDFW